MTSPFILRNMLLSHFQGRDEANNRLTQASIDVRPHFIPLDINILTQVIGPKLIPSYPISQFRQDVIEFVTNRYKFSLHSRGGLLYFGNLKVTKDNVRQYTPAVVYSGSSIVGVLFAAKDSYASAYQSLFRPFLNKVLNKKLKKTDSSYGKSFDVGHTNIETDVGSLGESVASKEAGNAFQALANSIEGLTESQTEVIDDVITKLNSVVADFEVHNTYSTTIKASLSKSFQQSLLSVDANIVIIQEATENRRDYGKLEQAFVKQVKDVLMTIHFSRNFKEEVEKRIADALEGKKTPNSRSNKDLGATTYSTKSKKVKTTSTKIQVPKFRNLQTNREIGLPKLLMLINYHLQDVVSANMQAPYEYDRGSRRILTYRTGRLAASGRVEKLVQSRSGMLTAFYTYMKNPYATFSVGGRQSLPSSRDPKILFSKSIREIASRYVANQMRSINV